MVEWFDCHAEIGRRIIPNPIQVADAAGLAALYAEIGVQRALVVHARMYQDAPQVSNPLVVAETQAFPQFEPTWAVLPPQTGEQGTPAEFVAAMRAHGVRALWAFPTDHEYLLNAVTFGPLFEEMRARKIPLLVKVAALGLHPAGWANLGTLLSEAPGLRMAVVLASVWGQDRYFRPLIERYPGLHLITSLYNLEGGIPAFCTRYGSERLLFGTSFPDCQPGGAMMTLLHSGISEDHVRAIAGGNLQRLLEEVSL
ncbi:MAG: amidohydrolase family protein [Armatimonadota bacterium]